MKKKILLFLIIFPIFLSGCNKNSENNAHINRTNLELDVYDSITNNTSTNNEYKKTDDNSNNSDSEQSKNTSFLETEIGKFSTNIIDKTENRQNNIRLTCTKLNNFTVESGKVFSFLQMVGETSEKTRI